MIAQTPLLGSDNFRGYAAIALAITSWAAAFPAIRLALEGYSPNNVAFLRYLIASIILAGYWGVRSIPLPDKKDLLGLTGISLAGITFYNLALNFGELEVPASTASFLIASGPVWIAILASKFLNEEISLAGWVSILLSLSGVAVISFGKGFVSPSLLLPTLAILGAAFAQSVYSLAQKYYLKRYKPFQLTTYVIWIGTLFLIPFCRNPLIEFNEASFLATGSVVFLGIVPSIFGYVSWTYALAKIPASKAGGFLYLLPVGSMLISWIFLGETPSKVSFWGGLIVLMGVTLLGISKQKSPNECLQS